LTEEHRLTLFENRVLWRIFGPKRDEITGKRKKLHTEKLYNLYPSPNVIRVIKSRPIWEGHIARMGRGEVRTGFWWGNMRERDHLEDTGVDGRVIRGVLINP